MFFMFCIVSLFKGISVTVASAILKIVESGTDPISKPIQFQYTKKFIHDFNAFASSKEL